MFDFSPEALQQFFVQYAYQPSYVYSFIIIFMTASSFGFPIPEELVLVSAGFIAHMAMRPDLYPPPTVGAETVELWTLCLVCLGAVFLSDLLVFYLGKFFGKKIIKTHFFEKRIAGSAYEKVNKWFHDLGWIACGVFRFTPGLRFPGHLTCGLMNIPSWKFIAVDGTAALISVPSQVFLVATYGDLILNKFKEFKIALLVIGGVALVIYLIRKIYLKNQIRPEDN